MLHITDAPFPILLNSPRDIEGVVSLMPTSPPCRPIPPFRRIPQTAHLDSATLVGFLAFPAFSLGRLGKPGRGSMPGRIIFLDNFSLNFSTQTRRVTWAYLADSTQARKKLDANNPPITYTPG